MKREVNNRDKYNGDVRDEDLEYHFIVSSVDKC